ncbi:MAG: bifunctional oligoribonuclease/PAP phosphatase NrnA [Huintestinicola sp.]
MAIEKKNHVDSISMAEAAKFFKENDNFYILTHVSPDGDAMGSGFGLCRILRNMGKKANVLCSDPFPMRYEFLWKDYELEKFSPNVIVSVDLADTNLFGKELSVYKGFVDLCIDHHISNTGYAKKTLLDGGASAACQVIYDMCIEGEMPVDEFAAECFYVGIATDTGCFKFENTTPRAHRIAADIIEKYDIPYAKINRELFDIKSRARMQAEQMAMSSMEMYLDDKCAIIAITSDTIAQTGLAKEEFEGMASLPMQIEGVEIGVTIKEKEPGKYKVSLRSVNTDVSAVCAKLGGGGHARAAGCTVEGDLQQAKLKLLSVIAPVLGFDLWLS